MHTDSFLCPFIHNFLSQPSRRSFGSLGLLSKHSLTKSSLTDFANSLRSQNTSDFLENSLNTQLPAFISLSLQDLTRVHSSLISRPLIYTTHVNIKIQEINLAEAPKRGTRACLAVLYNSSYALGLCNQALIFYTGSDLLYNVFFGCILDPHK